MQRKRKGLLELLMVCVLIFTVQPVMAANADGETEIEVKLYNGTEVLKPGRSSGQWESVKLLSETALNTDQPNLVAAYGADLKAHCPAGYVMDGWRVWSAEDSGLLSSRWISGEVWDWITYMTGCFDYNGNTILAPNWVPEYSAGYIMDTADGPAAVIKRTKDDSVIIKGNTVEGGSVEPDGSITVEDTKFSFQWLHEYKVVDTLSDVNQIAGTATEDGNYYNMSTRQWMKGDGQTNGMGIACDLEAGDVVVVNNIGNYYSQDSDWRYYFSACLINEEDGSQTFLETYDKENIVFYATVPESGSYTLYMRNTNHYMELNASVSVFRADVAVANQTGAVYTGDAGTYCCQMTYEKAGKTFSLLSNFTTITETPKYQITVECGENGSCVIEVDGKEITGSAIMAEEGQTVTIKTVPDTGYEESVVYVRYDAVPIGFDVPFTTTEGGNGNKIHIFIMPNYPIKISAKFQRMEAWVNNGITANGNYELKSGMPYKLGIGTWKIKGDNTVYAGGNTFYVPLTGNYKFQKQ